MVRAALITLTVFLASFAGVAEACLPPNKPFGWFDKRIEVAADCSFSEAEEDYYYSKSGQPVVDLDSGRIGQRMTYAHFCGPHESLLVVDCNTERLIVIDGQPDPTNPQDFGAGPTTSVSNLYPPNGRVRLTPNTTIESLEVLSRSEGYDYQTDAVQAFETAKKKNRYNPFCGCAVFYPESLGAQNAQANELKGQ